MNTLLWTLQGFLAIVFIYSGIMKATQQRDRLVSLGQTGVANLSYPVIRSIGLAEIAGAVGIILPRLTGIVPQLTPLAAGCFALIMVMAIPIHYRRAEFKSVAFNVVLLLMAGMVAYMR
ncbi:DoxX family protein [Chitinophaga arvensicola]|uniref:DoxX-like family protein n=1 Tax=Chitinophaga arvensicola TaxID=29529 RepID=A0A1I0R9R5_9BACT|nr:DoxX family protein [Chitinophaga arvensicola]SEW37572.1 DoxX-like family protein [Chitinophaga arvensicola]